MCETVRWRDKKKIDIERDGEMERQRGVGRGGGEEGADVWKGTK